MIQPDVDLPGATGKTALPQGVRQQHDVVRRRARLRPGRRADPLEQRVGLRQVDDAGHLDVHRRRAGAGDVHGVARGGVQIGGGLLGEQHSRVGADQGAQLAGECGAVITRQSQHHAGAGGLGAAAGGCGQRRRCGEVERGDRPHTRRRPDR
jgi:hypothetical protein